MSEQKVTGGGAAKKKRDVLTKAQWEKIQQQARRSEREPDAAQISMLPEAKKP